MWPVAHAITRERSRSTTRRSKPRAGRRRGDHGDRHATAGPDGARSCGFRDGPLASARVSREAVQAGAPRPKPSFRRRLAFGLTIALGPFLLLEVSLRLYFGLVASAESRRGFATFHGELDVPSRYRPHPYSAYALNPDFVGASGKMHHGADGFRKPSPKEGDDRRLIAALGGSTTYTVKVEEDALTYPAQLELALRDRSKDERIDVLNAGVPGYTTYESVANLAYKVLDRRPALIVVYHGANDLHARRVARYVGDNTGYRKSWGLESRPVFTAMRHCYHCRWLALRFGFKALAFEHYTRHQDELRENPPAALLKEHPPEPYRRNLRYLVRLAQSSGVPTALCTFASNPDFADHYASQPFYVSGFEEMNAVVRQVAEEEGAMLIDVAAELPRERELWFDGVHLTASGAKRKAEIIAKAIHAAPPWNDP